MTRSLAVAAALLVSGSAFAEGRFSVVLFTPGEPVEFYSMYAPAVVAAAADLDIELEILNAHGDHLRLVEMAQEVAARPVKPDYAIISNEKETGGRMFEAMKGAGIRSIASMSTFDPKQIVQYGRPREKEPLYVGQFRPDYEGAGAALAAALETAGSERFSAPLKLLAISGVKSTPAASRRDRGMVDYVAGSTNLSLQQLVHSTWQREKARRQMAGLLRRWPATQLIWAANDPMALGAMEAAQAAGREPGKDLLIGGVNWSVEALRHVKDGSLVASVGGHFFGGAWTLVLLRDLHDGVDFASEGLELTFPMGVIDRSNVDTYLGVFGDQDWEKIDFAKFSKSRNPKVQRYDFTLPRLLEQFGGK